MIRHPAALLCLLLVAGCSSVTIVRDEENPARQPFQEGVTVTFQAGSSGASPGQFFVPGQKFVIEYISATAGVPAGSGQNLQASITLFVGGIGMQSFLGPFTPIGRGPLGVPTDLFTLGQVVRLYADPNSLLRIDAVRTNGSSGEAFINVRLVGHLVAVP